MSKEIEHKIDSLIQITNKGFSDMQSNMDERFAQVDERFAQVDERFAQVDSRLTDLEDQIVEVREDVGEVKRVLDGMAGAVHNLQVEAGAQAVVNAQHEQWIKQIATAVQVKLA